MAFAMFVFISHSILLSVTQLERLEQRSFVILSVVFFKPDFPNDKTSSEESITYKISPFDLLKIIVSPI